MKWLYGLTFVWIALGLAIVALLIFAENAQAAQRCDFVVELLSVEGVPDEALAGEIFRTTWVLRDKNNCGWPTGLQLLFADGERMSGPTQLALRSPARGQDLLISFDLKAPEGIDEHYGAWQLAVDSRVIGPVLDLDLTVVTRTHEGPAPDLPHTVPLPETFMEIGEWADLPAESIADASVQCSEGIITGGGWTVMDGSYGPHVYRSVKDGNGWSISARNDSDHDSQLRAYAICLRNIPQNAVTFEVQEFYDLDAGEILSVAAECPEWGIRTGGGFDVYAYNELQLRASFPDANENSWKLLVRNGSFVSESAMVSVICLTGYLDVEADVHGTGAVQLEPMADVVPAGYREASCPIGWEASSGAVGNGFFIYFEALLIEGETWAIRAFNPHDIATTFGTSVTCLHLP